MTLIIIYGILIIGLAVFFLKARRKLRKLLNLRK
jgi:hypothetical protein